MSGGAEKALKIIWSNSLIFQRGKLSNREGKDLITESLETELGSICLTMSWNIFIENVIRFSVIFTLPVVLVL